MKTAPSRQSPPPKPLKHPEHPIMKEYQFGLDGTEVEGPMLLKFNDEAKWELMPDGYSASGGYMPPGTTDISSPTKGTGGDSLRFFKALPTRCFPYPVPPLNFGAPLFSATEAHPNSRSVPGKNLFNPEVRYILLRCFIRGRLIRCYRDELLGTLSFFW
jgi:hypothetical protein